MGNDFALVIGWPHAYCKQPGFWFDPIGRILGMNRNGFYKVGHSAIVLIDVKNKKCEYFDFGRYHAPFKKGRVRDQVTDPLLKIKTIPIFSEDQQSILNVDQILEELQMNEEIHTEGKIISSYLKISFNLAYKEGKKLQRMGVLDYGLFNSVKYNCAKFVYQLILAGKPHWVNRLKLACFVPLIPSTKSNVFVFGFKKSLPHLRLGDLFYPKQKVSSSFLNNVLEEPFKPSSVHVNARWLGGEGVGGWFYLELLNQKYLVSRWTDSGFLVSKAEFEMIGEGEFFHERNYSVGYPSNSQVVTLLQTGKSFRFEIKE